MRAPHSEQGLAAEGGQWGHMHCLVPTQWQHGQEVGGSLVTHKLDELPILQHGLHHASQCFVFFRCGGVGQVPSLPPCVLLLKNGGQSANNNNNTKWAPRQTKGRLGVPRVGG